MKTRIVGLLATAVLVTLGTSAYADPIGVIGGSVGSDFEVTDVDLITQSFSVSLFGARISAPAYAHLTLGAIEDFSATFTGPLVNVGERDSVISGVAYHNQGDLLAVANLQFIATP